MRTKIACNLLCNVLCAILLTFESKKKVLNCQLEANLFLKTKHSKQSKVTTKVRDDSEVEVLEVISTLIR